jgi:hypothetical protein
MNENIIASVSGLNEAIASISVVKFHYSLCHRGPFVDLCVVARPDVQAHALEVQLSMFGRV